MSMYMLIEFSQTKSKAGCIYMFHSFLPTNGALTQVPALGKNTKFYEV